MLLQKNGNKLVPRSSNIWQGFMRTLSCLSRGILWKIGNGVSIVLGNDPFVRGESFYLLSRELVSFLVGLGINRLSHIKSSSQVLLDVNDWMSIDELAFLSTLSFEWNNLLTRLHHLGIRLKEKVDVMMWGEDISDVKISVKKVYDVIANTTLSSISCWWYNKMWK